MKPLLLFICLSLLAALSCPAAGETVVYFGTYTRGPSKGIYVSRLNLETGTLSQPQLAIESVNPSFLALHPDGRFLYAANEIGTFKGEPAGSVSAFAIDPKSRLLKPLNQQSSRGAGPCHLVVDKAGKNVLVANYGGGSVAVLPIRADGLLGPASAFIQHKGSSVNPQRQAGPHAHSINLDPANRFAFVADLGLDKVLVYRFDAAKGTLSPHEPAFVAVKPGSGPRHFAFSPDGARAYVLNELLSTLTAFRYDAARGVLTETETVPTLPERFTGVSTTAEVQVHPSGRFVFASNRGYDRITVFAVDAATGALKAVEHQSTHGRTPRNFGIDPSGRFLIAANQNSNSVVVFRIDPEKGHLSPAGPRTDIGSPVCVKFLVAK